jgi:glycosyltransferase involved in cell wall biosynthesis
MISIVLTYYNRRKLLEATLKSIRKSDYKDYEIIVVDDGSTELIDDIEGIRLLRIEPSDKWYFNSCIPFNIGFKEAKGDIIIIQNAECLHVHDILTYVSKNVNNTNYISFSAYSINEDMTYFLPNSLYPNYNIFLHAFSCFPQQSVIDYVGWYNHSVYRPVHYHFCAAITKKNLSILGGFDERYAKGTGYEDDDLVDRIRRLKLNMKIEDNLSIIHQWHPKVYDINNKKVAEMFRMNGQLHKMTKRESIIHVND